ncbi:hypothetical protein GCM10028828_16230 [Corynebacterium tapiri]
MASCSGADNAAQPGGGAAGSGGSSAELKAITDNADFASKMNCFEMPDSVAGKTTLTCSSKPESGLTAAYKFASKKDFASAEEFGNADVDASVEQTAQADKSMSEDQLRQAFLGSLFIVDGEQVVGTCTGMEDACQQGVEPLKMTSKPHPENTSKQDIDAYYQQQEDQKKADEEKSKAEAQLFDPNAPLAPYAGFKSATEARASINKLDPEANCSTKQFKDGEGVDCGLSILALGKDKKFLQDSGMNKEETHTNIFFVEKDGWTMACPEYKKGLCEKVAEYAGAEVKPE